MVSKVLFRFVLLEIKNILHILLIKSPCRKYTQMLSVAKEVITSVTEHNMSTTKMQSTYFHTFSFKSLPETIVCMHWIINVNRLTLNIHISLHVQPQPHGPKMYLNKIFNVVFPCSIIYLLLWMSWSYLVCIFFQWILRHIRVNTFRL